ncbi:hypothetical protein AJ78_07585 [Emergomyces pasteurianus Ep9510]|uniref:Uncharacterized protein n=1 Tax=Emergomyces pasteurianus Ep9510 TaxID=1447872 RepID=A0A1J9P6G0_9EURO|nr:hypothetical protein AJ78_07585 [Emergomyces pasteurianus Ep9510]
MPNANRGTRRLSSTSSDVKGGDNTSHQDEIMEIHSQVLQVIEILGQISAILETIEIKEQYDADLRASAKENRDVAHQQLSVGRLLSDYAFRMNPKIQELLAELERERAERERERAERERERAERERERAELDQERQWRQDAEAEARSERRRREEAEALAASSESSTLPVFLHACHELLLAIKIVTDPTRTTQGVTADLNSDDQQSSVEPMIKTESSIEKRMSKKNKTKKKETTMIMRGQADRFYIYCQNGDEHIPALAIKYKTLHKLTQDKIMRGLTQNIHPFKEVIDKNLDNSDFCLKEAFIFLHILNNSSSVMCSVCTLSLDVEEINDDSLHLTAIAQILAFILRALVSSSALQEWYDAVTELDI